MSDIQDTTPLEFEHPAPLIEPPETFTAQLQAPPRPRRSWKRGDRAAGTYDARFEYEGTTVYIQSLDDWDALEAQEEEIQDESDGIQEDAQALEALEKLKPEELDAKGLAPRDLRQRRRALNKRTTAIAEKLFKFQQDVVCQTVVNWSKAPVPYSAEAVAELPREMIADWAQVILEKSRLGSSNAGFLANK